MSILEQVSFTSGEISPSLYARTDLARYQSGVKKLLNFIPMQYGGVRNRAGFKAIPCSFNQYDYDISTSIMIPFSRSENENIIIMINGGDIRFVKNGSLITYSEKNITNITKATTAVVTSIGHGYLNDDVILINGVIGMNQVNNREFIVKAVTANTFQLWESDKTIGDVAVDSTNYDTYLQSGDAFKIYKLTSPYASNDTRTIDYVQSVDLVVLANDGYNPKALRYMGDTDWTISDFICSSGPFKSLNTTDNTVVYYAAGSRLFSRPNGVFTGSNVGQLVKLQTDDFGIPWEAGVVVATNDIRRAGDNFYQATIFGTTGTLRPTHSIGDASDGTINWRYLHSGIGIVKITSFISPKEVMVEVIDHVPEGCYRINYGINSPSITIVNGGAGGTNGNFPLGIVGGSFITTAVGNFDVVGGVVVAINITGSGTYYLESPTLDFSASVGLAGVVVTVNLVNLLGAGNPSIPSKRWAFGAFGGAEGYPKSVNLYQERLIFGGTTRQPETVFTSVVGSYDDFSTSSPLKDDDALVFTLAGRKLNKIKFIEGIQDLLCFTSAGESLIAGGQNQVLTPSTLSVRPQSNYGTAQVKPVLVGDGVIFVHQNGSTIFDMAFNSDATTSSGIVASDITLLANHLFSGRTIVKLAYQQTPDRTIWAVRDDGMLLSCTYLKDQQVIAWAQHTTDGLFKDVCVIQEDSHDVLYAIVERDGVGTLEFMQQRDVTTIYDSFFVDGGYSYNGVNNIFITMTLTGGTLWDDSEALTMTANSSVFTSDDVGQYVFLYDGDTVVKFVITVYTSPTVISVISDRTIPLSLRSVAVNTWSFALLEVGGLWSLNGKTVSILANGNVEPQQVVTNGKVILQSASDRFSIGLPYVSDLETLKINVLGSRDGTTQTKQKLINKVSLICQDTRGIFAGADDAHLREYRPPKRTTYTDPLEMVSGLFEQTIASSYDKQGSILIRQSDPLPVTILSIIPEVTVGGA